MTPAVQRLDPRASAELEDGVGVLSFPAAVEDCVLNALQAGATCIRVEVDPSSLSFCVEDDGTGMNEAALDALREAGSHSATEASRPVLPGHPAQPPHPVTRAAIGFLQTSIRAFSRESQGSPTCASSPSPRGASRPWSWCSRAQGGPGSGRRERTGRGRWSSSRTSGSTLPCGAPRLSRGDTLPGRHHAGPAHCRLPDATAFPAPQSTPPCRQSRPLHHPAGCRPPWGRLPPHRRPEAQADAARQGWPHPRADAPVASWRGRRLRGALRRPPRLGQRFRRRPRPTQGGRVEGVPSRPCERPSRGGRWVAGARNAASGARSEDDMLVGHGPFSQISSPSACMPPSVMSWLSSWSAAPRARTPRTPLSECQRTSSRSRGRQTGALRGEGRPGGVRATGPVVYVLWPTSHAGTWRSATPTP